ncbi:redoxin domain-containing protein, partial [bacterium]
MNKIKRILSVLFLILLGSLQSSDAVEIETGDEVPDFTLSAVGGGLVKLSDYREKVVVLIYWRTEQERSLVTIEEVKAIQERYG